MSNVLGFGFDLAGGSRYGPYSNLLSDNTDLWFSNRLYKLNGAVVPETTIDGYHTRASARMAQSAGGIWVPYASGNAAFVSGVGYDHRESFTNLSPNGLDPRSMTDNSCTSTNEAGTILGFANAVRIASTGSDNDRKRDYLATAPANGTSYGVSFVYQEGTSPYVLFSMRNVTTGQNSWLSGAHGTLTNPVTDAGTITDVVMTEVQAGIWLVECLFNCTTTGSNWSAGFGPYSNTSGLDIVLAALQVANKPYVMPFATGTTAADSFGITSAAAGIDIDPSLSGFAMVWRGKLTDTNNNYRTPLEAYIDPSNRVYIQRNAANNTYEISIQRSAGYKTLTSVTPVTSYDDTDMTIGVTLRTDGSWKAKIHTAVAATGTGETLPAGSFANLNIGVYSTGGTANGICKRVIVEPASITDAEFDDLFGRVAA